MKCEPCKGLGYIPRDPMPKGVKNGVAICLDCSGSGEAKIKVHVSPERAARGGHVGIQVGDKVEITVIGQREPTILDQIIEHGRRCAIGLGPGSR